MNKYFFNSIKVVSLKLAIHSLFLILMVFVPLIVTAEEAAVQLLNRMNHSLHKLNYKGTLAYLRGNSLSTLRIEHSVVNGKESEHVVRLNEAGGEISRELTGFSLASIPKIRPEMEKVYSFDMGRQNRIANIPCTIITARPKDRARYLQKYCIDTQSGMLLDYMLVGKSHKPVEQFMFTSIEIRLPEEVSNPNPNSNADALNPATAVWDQNVTALPQQKSTIIVPQGQSISRHISNAMLEDGWVMESLPAGYNIKQAPHLKSTEKDTDAITKHYVLSDGLSSLSVFVSPLSAHDSSMAVKVNSGALNVVTQEKAGHIITVVGEVPETTLKDIVKNLRKK